MATQALSSGAKFGVAAAELEIDEEEQSRARTRRYSTIGRWAVGLSMLVLWEVLTRLKIVDAYFFSSPVLIAQTAFKAATAGSLWTDVSPASRWAPRSVSRRGGRTCTATCSSRIS
jgi:hypothetical protein